MGIDLENVLTTIEVKWYSTFVLLVGAILSVADPITDILTLIEFYRNDHKTWFSVGLIFVILPSLSFSVLYCIRLETSQDGTDEKCPGFRPFAEVLVCGCNPFAVAFTRLRAFILCAKNFKKLWNRKELDADSNTQIKDLIYYATWSGMFEAIFESAPQFVIQLYAMIVQQEQIAIIHVMSLCVSFLSLAWTFINADGWRLTSLDDPLSRVTKVTIKVMVGLYVSQLFYLSGRLLAITFFTVSFKWWIIAVLLIHSIVMGITRCWVDFKRNTCTFYCHDCSFDCGDFLPNLVLCPVALCIYWIRDDGAAGITAAEDGGSLKVIQLVSNILYVIENLIMIWVYYFNEQSHPSYSKPVMVCVCVFSILGALMRVILYRYLSSTNVGPDHSDRIESDRINLDRQGGLEAYPTMQRE